MATTADYIEFVSEQVKDFGEVRYKKMFGEYMCYIDNKPVLLVCDNTVFVGKYPEIEEIMKDASCGFPYDGAKEKYILDIENAELLKEVIPELCKLTPLPKPKKKKIK